LFSGQQTRNIYQLLVTLHGGTDGDVDVGTLEIGLEQSYAGKATDYKHLLDVIGLQDPDQGGLDGIVRRHIQTQLLLGVAEKIGRFATGGSEDVHDIAQAALAAADIQSTKAPLLDYAEHAGIYTEEAVYADAIPTGLHDPLDEYLKGGISQGEIFSLVGTPGAGKTSLLIHVGATALRAARRVLHVTTEISGIRVANRYDHSIRPADLAASVALGGKLWIRDVGDSDVTPLEIESFIRRELPDRPHCIIVDYADQLRSSKSYDEKRHELNRVYMELRQLSKRLKVPIFTATQATRGAMGKRIIGMEDIAESFDIARIADVLVSINPYEDTNIVGLKVIKARRRSTRPMFDVEVDYENCRVR